jgi:hypothetical protein
MDDGARLKHCTSCGLKFAATLEFFGPHKLGRFGLTPACRACIRADCAKRRARPDQAARQQAWRNANKEKVRAANEAYRKAGYSSTANVAKWRAENLEHARLKSREYQRLKRRCAAYVLKQRVTARMHAMLRGKNGRGTETLLGYTRDELKLHIGRQFTPGMSWEKLIAGEIHVDHIIPFSKFKIDSYESPDFKACWALSNLRPLWARDNLKKSAQVLTLL